MAKMSNLDKAIAAAQGAFDEAQMQYRMCGSVLDALRAAKGHISDDTMQPKVKRGRKPKGLPKGEVAT